ncbi:hypothetical protein M0805_009101 [Coniferiporia weirii]|nr:hypothetical protein M0805_009101 [Coniferiporia weirii]
MSVDSLEPRIRQIILATPLAELGTITAKDVRAQLVTGAPEIDEAWVKTNKKAINALISRVFEAHVPAQSVSAAAKKEESDGADLYAGYSGGEGGGSLPDDEDDGGSSSFQDKPKKTGKTKRELTDEEYARQLSSEINGRSRSSRSGKAPTGRAVKKGASRTSKKNKKSAERVADSDASDDDDGSEPVVKPKKKRAGGSSGGGAKGGFMKEYVLSAPLSALLEVDRLSRPQVVKQLWVYIKSNDLQNPSNKREILCDDRLRPVFNSDKIDMFKMNKVLGQHLHEDE